MSPSPVTTALTQRETTVVLTGVTRGIGREAALWIAKHYPKAHLVLLVRRSPSENEIDALRPAAGAVHVIEADLASLHGVRSACARVRFLMESDGVPDLSALVLNAAELRSDALGESTDGFEETFAVNVLATHLLVAELEEFVEENGRIIVTTGDTLVGERRTNLGMTPPPQWQEPSALARPGAFAGPGSVGAGRAAFSTSKLAALRLVHAYSQALSHLNVVAFNPGLVPDGQVARTASGFARWFGTRVLPKFVGADPAITSAEAGAHLARLAMGETPARSGSYVTRDAVAETPVTRDADTESELVDFVSSATDTWLARG